MRTWIRWALGVVIVVGLLLFFDTSDVWAQLRSANVWLAAPAIAGMVGVHAVAAAAWRELSCTLSDLELPWRATLQHYYAAQAVGGVTPGNLGGDAYRLYALGAEGSGWSRTLMPIIAQRVTSYLALSILAAVALLLLPNVGNLAAAAVASGLVLSTLAVGIVVAALQAPPSQWRPKLPIVSRLKLSTGWHAVSFGTASRGLFVALLLGLVFHLTSIALSYALVRSVDANGLPAQVAAALAVARLSIVIPLSPSGLGFQEGALALLFLSIGMAPETALAASLLNRVALLITTLLGAALLLRRPTGAEPVPQKPVAD